MFAYTIVYDMIRRRKYTKKGDEMKWKSFVMVTLLIITHGLFLYEETDGEYTINDTSGTRGDFTFN